MKQTFDFDHMKDGDEVVIKGITYVLHIGYDKNTCEGCDLSMSCKKILWSLMKIPCGDGVWEEVNHDDV